MIPGRHSAKKLYGDEKYCLRLGRYQILYSVDDNIFTVTVIKVGHRRDVYA